MMLYRPMEDLMSTLIMVRIFHHIQWVKLLPTLWAMQFAKLY